MHSKFINKSAQVGLIFSNKANEAKSLMDPFWAILSKSGTMGVDKEIKITYSDVFLYFIVTGFLK